jgi:hypothetical protein
MNKLLLLLSFSLLMITCEKEKISQYPETPDWLKARIALDEEIIKSNPQSSLGIADWIMYNYDGNYYIEYLNLLSSSFPPVYNYDGVQITYNQDTYLAYTSNKCCKKYVWKGPLYIEI